VYSMVNYCVHYAMFGSFGVVLVSGRFCYDAVDDVLDVT
jgi:hypothetical protein